MQRLFYATADDLLPVFECVESKHRLAYALCGLFLSRESESYPAGALLPSLRQPATHPNAIAGAQYLVTPADQAVVVRDVPQKPGGIRYAIDQLANPDSITIQPCGIYPPDVLLHGRVATVSSTAFASLVQRAFASAVAKFFQHIQAFYVGPKAHELWRSGYRLTQSAQSPREYDLAD
jgi:hypothetical protein